MKSQLDDANGLGLQFFGSMTASISHELKNALAIVNENAGLLGDLVHLAAKGRPLDPTRLNTVADKIRQQVQRADTIIKRLNQFAHSAYDPPVLMDLHEVLDYTIALTARLAAMKNITITVARSGEVRALMAPFPLENLLWLCLQPVLASGNGQGVTLSCLDNGPEITLVMQLEAGLLATKIHEEAAVKAAPLLAALQATLTTDSNNNALVITLPKKQG